MREKPKFIAHLTGKHVKGRLFIDEMRDGLACKVVPTIIFFILYTISLLFNKKVNKLIFEN